MDLRREMGPVLQYGRVPTVPSHRELLLSDPWYCRRRAGAGAIRVYARHVTRLDGRALPFPVAAQALVALIFLAPGIALPQLNLTYAICLAGAADPIAGLPRDLVLTSLRVCLMVLHHLKVPRNV